AHRLPVVQLLPVSVHPQEDTDAPDILSALFDVAAGHGITCSFSICIPATSRRDEFRHRTERIAESQYPCLWPQTEQEGTMVRETTSLSQCLRPTPGGPARRFVPLYARPLFGY